MRIDPIFVLCVKEEVAAGEVVALVVGTRRDEERYRACFTDEELESIRFVRGEDTITHLCDRPSREGDGRKEGP